MTIDMDLNFDFDDIAKEAYTWEASDIILKPNKYPAIRIHGEIKRIPERKEISASDINDILGLILNDKDLRQLNDKGYVDKSHDVDERFRLRVSIAKSYEGRNQEGMTVVSRIIPRHIPTLEEYKMPKIFENLALEHNGLIIVGGITGSGKSTTIASMIEHINQNKCSHIITIEDPIEFVHEDKKSVFTRREIGTHVESFSNGLRTALRQDPDVMLVGEMRDLETMRAAMDAAETGHLVFATVHAGEVDDMPERIIQQFRDDEQNQVRTQIANVGLAFIAQALIPKIKGGRVAAFEILILTSSARNLIREGRSIQLPTVMQTGRKWGMITLTEYLMELHAKKIISDENLVYYSSNKERARDHALSQQKVDINQPYYIPNVEY